MVPGMQPRARSLELAVVLGLQRGINQVAAGALFKLAGAERYSEHFHSCSQ